MSKNGNKPTVSLAEQRIALRNQLQARRQEIALQLSTDAPNDNTYPRSKTMRFFSQRSGVMSQLLGEGAKLMASAGFAKSLLTAVTLTKLLRAKLPAK